MKNIIETPSLCPYLESNEARFYLAFCPVFPDSVIEGKAPFPFIGIDPSGPLSRIVMAHIVSDAGSKIKPVFVALQQDVYKIVKDPLFPFGNKEVEACWQKAFSACSGQDVEDAPAVLSVQTGEDGQLVPFESLFYCKRTKFFFPPPCPACGNTLHQCYDDDWLIGQGLQPYSTSLKRYLFCPNCSDLAGQSDFYVYELDGSDSPGLKDRWDLIRGFGRLIEGKIQADRFPCSECSDNQDCYDTHSRAVSRITPFCFYPFFMLIYPSMSVQGQDFLALLSGGTAEALRKQLEANGEIGRACCVEKLQKNKGLETGFLFYGDKRHFLEVLYLKLCFLNMLFHTLNSGPDSFGYPDTGPSVDGVWVKLDNEGSLLPFFWVFNARVIGPQSTAQSSAVPGIPSGHGLYSMGVLWLYALLVNKVQGVAQVFGAIKAAMEKSAGLDETDQEGILKKYVADAVSPANIFWDPPAYAEKPFDHEWLTLWNRAVDMGWALLTAGIKGHSGFSMEAFWQDCGKLREQIKKHLFAGRPAPALDEVSKLDTASGMEAQQRFSVDKSISNTLANILDKWRKELETTQDEDTKTGIKGRERDLEETVILSPESSESKAQTAVAGDDDEIHETVILSSGDFAKGSAHVATEQADLEQTVIVSATSGPAEIATSEETATQAPRRARSTGEEIPETVVIPTSYANEAKSRYITPEEKAPGATTQEDEAPATVIISPGHGGDGRGASPGPEKAGEDVTSDKRFNGGEDDDLSETVVIRTKQPMDKK